MWSLFLRRSHQIVSEKKNSQRRESGGRERKSERDASSEVRFRVQNEIRHFQGTLVREIYPAYQPIIDVSSVATKERRAKEARP